MPSFGKYKSFADFRSYLEIELAAHLSQIDKAEKVRKYRFEHCQRVAHIGRKLAETEPSLRELGDWLEIGCLLHDIGKWDAEVAVDHGRAGALVVKELLEAADISISLSPAAALSPAAQVVQGVAMHVDKHWNPRSDIGSTQNRAGIPYLFFTEQPSLLASSIGECDDIDRYSAYRIHDTLCYVDFLAKSTAEQRTWIQEYLLHLRSIENLPRSTETTRKWWKNNIAFQAAYFQKLLAETSAC